MNGSGMLPFFIKRLERMSGMFFLGQVDVDSIERLGKTDYTTTGILVLACIAMGAFIWRALSWVESRGDQVITRSFTHLDKVDTTLSNVSTVMSQLIQRLDTIESKLDGVLDRVDEIDNHLGRNK